MDLGIKGKLALVTGGTMGLGYAIAKGLAKEGVKVVIASRSEANVEKALGELRAEVPNCHVEGTLIDMSSESSIESAFNEVSKKGTIELLLNNTGGPPAGEILNSPLSNWDLGYQVLLRSTVQLTQLAVPKMKEAGFGRVLTVTSSAAKERIPNLPISATFRAGLSAWVVHLAKEVGRSGILVNNLLPGATNTARLKELETKSPEFYKSMNEASAIGRIAEPNEIGNIGTFLLSAANATITGTDVLADCGATQSH